MDNHHNILVVEDSPVQAEMLRRLLESNDFRVTVATNGKEALALLHELRPSLVLSDIIMPEMDGYELVREIRRNESFRDVPVLLLTTLSDLDDVIRGLEAQADDYLTKPYDPDFLLMKIRSTLKAPRDLQRPRERQQFRITVDGKTHTVVVDPYNFLSLLLSTYENTIHTNQRLVKAQSELKELNRQLEEIVRERTAHLEAEISKRERLEEELRESYGQFKATIETAADSIVTADSSGNISIWNSAATRAFGYSAEEALGQPVTIVVPERYHEIHQAAFEKARTLGRLAHGIRIHEVECRRKDGSEFPAELSFSTWMSREGIVCTAIIRDITERKRAERELLESYERFHSLVETAADPIIGADSSGRITMWNPAAASSFGYSAEEVMGRDVVLLMPERYRELHRLAFEKAITAGRLLQAKRIREAHACRKDGSEFPVEISISAWTTQQGMSFTAIIRDITERKMAEEQLRALSQDLMERNRQLTVTTEDLKKKTEELQNMTQQLWQAAKLATIGELAASIAHELNNPLATVSLRTEGLLAKTEPDHPNRRSLEIVGQELQRMANLVANLLQFSRRYGKQISTVNPREEMDTTLELVRGHLINHGIQVVRECAQDIPEIRADRQQLRQLFLNLITNASDAMPAGGTLMIRSKAVSTPPGHILMEMEDTGHGIDSETMEHVMEPFFTTKPEGKGTGLGLPICRRIVHDHGGTLEISSEVGKGTRVSITFPLPQTSNATNRGEQ